MRISFSGVFSLFYGSQAPGVSTLVRQGWAGHVHVHTIPVEEPLASTTEQEESTHLSFEAKVTTYSLHLPLDALKTYRFL